MQRPTNKGQARPLAVRLSEPVYALLLRLAYPREFRASFGRDMREMFRDRCAADVAAGGSRALLPVWAATVADLMRHGAAERSARRGGSGYKPLRGTGTDVLLAVRGLRKTPGFTAIALITLALGIGANTAVFSVIDAALLADLPYPEADSLLMLSRYDAPVGADRPFSYPDITDIAAEAESFAALSPFTNSTAVVARGTQGRRVAASSVGQGFFDTLGVTPALGRTIQPADQGPAAEPVVVLGYALWNMEFGADPGIVGDTVRIDSRPHTVVGIMPAEFSFPPGKELWMPLEPNESRSDHRLSAIGRLAAGVSEEQARVEASGIIARLEQEYPGRYQNNSVSTISVREEYVGNLRPTLMVLLLAVGAVLLIGCVNVANLLLARSSARQHEIAVRAALGAGRVRIVRQLLTESLVLASVGGALGVLLAYQGTDLLVAMVPGESPALEATVNLRLLGFSAGLVLLTGVLFGLAPALRSARVDLNASLKDEGRGVGAGRTRTSGRRALVVAEVAAAVVLLVGAGLMVRTMRGLVGVDIGFDPADAWVLRLDVPLDANAADFDQLAAQARVGGFYRDLQQRTDALPGVTGSGAVAFAPFSGALWGSFTMAQGQPVVPRPERYRGSWNTITPGYFEALGVRLVSGRFFRPGDDAEAEPVAVINETLARALWPDRDPLGERLTNGNPPDAGWLTVVGVVADHRTDGLVDVPIGEVYQVHAQATYTEMNLVVRAANLAAVAPGIRAAITDLEPTLTVADFRPLSSFVDRHRGSARFLTTLLSLFSAVAMALAAVGTYGVISYGVHQRKHELGVRRALGARGADIVHLVTASGLRLTLFGVAIGLSGAWALTRLMAGLLYQVNPADPLTFVAAGGLAVVVALAACLLPAVRASRIDPLVALRND